MPALKVDAEFQGLIPSLTPDEYNRLQASIIEHGCLSPLIVWGCTILDGHNRHEICQAHKKAFPVKMLDFADRDAAKRWIIEHQLGRRNLNESQRAMLAARLSDASQGQPKKKGANLHLSFIADLAEKEHVSPRTVKDARKVISDGAPELQKAVTDGKVSVSAAAKIVDRPKEEQANLAAQGKAAVAKAAKEEPKAQPGPAVDRLGRPLPEDKPKIIQAFANDPVFPFMQELSNIKGRVRDAATGKQWTGFNLSKFNADIDNARATLKAIRPYALCPYCRDGGGCKACNGRGWVGEWTYNAAPKEMKYVPGTI
jgi:ParB-like chromosome segregation protein Spo0J